MLNKWPDKHPGCDSLLRDMATAVIYIFPQAPVTAHTIVSSMRSSSQLCGHMLPHILVVAARPQHGNSAAMARVKM